MTTEIQRKTLTIQVPTWKRLKQLQIDIGVYGHDQAIRFLFDEYEKKLNNLVDE